MAVTVRDTLLLTSQGAGLHELGEMYGLPKLELPDGAIEHMDELLRNDPALFERYALRDAEIAARHALTMAELNYELNNRCEVPVTLGGLAIRFSQSTWNEQGIDALQVLGQEIEHDQKFDRRSGRTRKVKKTVFRAALREHYDLATECYHGGRNEGFYFGATPKGQWVDVDLCGAYSTALAAIGMPLWDELRVTTNVIDYTPDILGFARVRFRFPDDVQFPCLPVRALNNLIFPRCGTTYATAPEIWLAGQLGADIEILHGVVIPMGPLKPFQKVIEGATRRRTAAKAAGDALRDKLFKEIVNSLYGKTAQGLRAKRAFDTRIGATAELPASEITNPFIAAAVTGLIRAVLAEMMNSLPPTRSMISVTTDGFITDVTKPELEAMQAAPLCQDFRRARVELTGDAGIVEVKHRVTQVLCWRTRGQATIEATPGEELILAKAGFKTPRGLDKAGQNAVMLDYFRDREITTTYEFKNLRPLSAIYKTGGDLVSENFLRRLRMDYDWKRRPVRGRTAEIDGYPHLAFETEPWDTVEQFQECREQWRQFQQNTGRCLKTESDLEAFLEFAAGTGLNKAGLYRSKGGMAAAAVKMFLRAFVRSEWGLDAVMSYAELADFLRHGGFAVKVETIKNARRPGSKLAEGVVTRTGAVIAFVNYVKTKFPGFEEVRMLEPNLVVLTYAKGKKEYLELEGRSRASRCSPAGWGPGVIRPLWVYPRPQITPVFRRHFFRPQSRNPFSPRASHPGCRQSRRAARSQPPRRRRPSVSAHPIKPGHSAHENHNPTTGHHTVLDCPLPPRGQRYHSAGRETDRHQVCPGHRSGYGNTVKGRHANGETRRHPARRRHPNPCRDHRQQRARIYAGDVGRGGLPDNRPLRRWRDPLACRWVSPMLIRFVDKSVLGSSIPRWIVLCYILICYATG